MFGMLVPAVPQCRHIALLHISQAQNQSITYAYVIHREEAGRLHVWTVKNPKRGSETTMWMEVCHRGDNE